MFLPLKPHLPAISYFPFLKPPPSSKIHSPQPQSTNYLYSSKILLPNLRREDTPSQIPARKYSFPNSGAKILLPKLRRENTPSQASARKYSFPAPETVRKPQVRIIVIPA